MARISFLESGGQTRMIEGEDGFSVMEVAVRSGVKRIEADCGGACACATCHVYVAPEWRERVGEATSDEAEMLEFAAHPREGSRLSCQLRISAALDGLVVHVPESQH